MYLNGIKMQNKQRTKSLHNAFEVSKVYWSIKKFLKTAKQKRAAIYKLLSKVSKVYKI